MSKRITEQVTLTLDTRCVNQIKKLIEHYGNGNRSWIVRYLVNQKYYEIFGKDPQEDEAE